MLCTSIDALRSPRGVAERVVIVGAGTVGLYLAKLLTDRGRHVVVIESGGTQLAGFDDSSFRSVGRRHDGIRIGRSRALGGTSNLWGGQLVEFRPHDLDGRSWLPGSRWPIPFEELRSYYERTFERLGVSRRFHDDRAVFEAVAGEMPELGPSVEVFLTRWLNVPNVAVMYAADVERSRSLQVLLHHTVTGFAGQGASVHGVLVVAPDGAEVLVEGGTVVVAAGTVESTRLLLKAAADQGWDCPWRDNDMLGRRFQDHLGGPVATLHADDHKRVMRIFSTIRWKRQKFQPKLRLRAARLEAGKLLGVTGIVWFESSISEHLVYLKQFLKAAIYGRRISGVRDFFRHAAASARHLPPLMWAYLREHRVAAPGQARVVLSVQAEQLPLADSRLTLASTALPDAGLPPVELDWRVDGCELTSIRELALEARKAFAEHGLGRLEVDPRLLAGDAAFLDELRDTSHAAGGCVVGESSDDGVVDRDLRVFGTDNLYVAGAATFRTSSDANVTFTAMALATRLADHLTGGTE